MLVLEKFTRYNWTTDVDEPVENVVPKNFIQAFKIIIEAESQNTPLWIAGVRAFGKP